MTDDALISRLDALIAILDRWAPPPNPRPDFAAADAFLWHADGRRLAPVPVVSRVDLSLLKGIDANRDRLLENTRRFADGLPANNALLWGARGMGKSSLVKAVHASIAGLKLVEIHREDIASLPDLMGLLRPAPHRFVVLCDDLSFDAGRGTSYKSLKAVLDGGVEVAAGETSSSTPPPTAGTSSPRLWWRIEPKPHQPRRRRGEKVSLSTLSACGSAFTALLAGRVSRDGGRLRSRPSHPGRAGGLRLGALEWATTRASALRPLVAWQFVQDLAGRRG